MKKIFAFVGGIIVVVLAVLGCVFVTMKHVHKVSYKDEAIKWIPALEKVFDKEETSKDDDIVIEEENPSEENDEQTEVTDGAQTE